MTLNSFLVLVTKELDRAQFLSWERRGLTSVFLPEDVSSCGCLVLYLRSLGGFVALYPAVGIFIETVGRKKWPVHPLSFMIKGRGSRGKLKGKANIGYGRSEYGVMFLHSL